MKRLIRPLSADVRWRRTRVSLWFFKKDRGGRKDVYSISARGLAVLVAGTIALLVVLAKAIFNWLSGS
jgi:hypothetical protein